jgi:hypothetical protein
MLGLEAGSLEAWTLDYQLARHLSAPLAADESEPIEPLRRTDPVALAKELDRIGG